MYDKETLPMVEKAKSLLKTIFDGEAISREKDKKMLKWIIHHLLSR